MCRDLATSDALAQAIAEREGIPVEQQRLVSAGRPLRPGRSLTEQRIGAASTVELLLRLEGGAPKKGKGDKKGKDKKGKEKGDKGGKAPLGEVRPPWRASLLPVSCSAIRCLVGGGCILLSRELPTCVLGVNGSGAAVRPPATTIDRLSLCPAFMSR